MVKERARHTAVLLTDGRVLVVGGEDANGEPLDSTEIYDPSVREWSLSSTLLEPRSDHTSVVLHDGRVLIIGGTGRGDKDLATVEVYDPSCEQWSAAAKLIEPRYRHASSLLADGRVIVTGNYLWPDDVVLDSVEVYDPVTNIWTYLANMNEERRDHTATLLENGKVLVSGGETCEGLGVCKRNNDRNPTRLSELYDPATDSWSESSSMPTRISDHASVLLNDGRVLITGGIDIAGYTSFSTQIYDSEKDSWSSARDMPTPRYLHAAVTLQDGMVLVVGGSSACKDGVVVNPEEVYDPFMDTWNSAGYMGASRRLHTVVLLRDGSVLVAGGYDSCSGEVLRSVEIYSP